MQITETEIILPVSINRNKTISSRKDAIYLCTVGILMLSGGIFVLVSQEELVPIAGHVILSILLIVLGVLILLGSIVMLITFRQDDHSRCVRISHEGIFFPVLFPAIVEWSEIAEIVPYTLTYFGPSQTILAFVPQDPEAMIARIIERGGKNFLLHFLAKTNMYFYRRSNALSPLNIPQTILPIHIDELIKMIQERFSSELNKHCITVLDYPRAKNDPTT